MKRLPSAIGWWERRRLRFTLFVLAAGCATIFLLSSATYHFRAFGEDALEPPGIILGLLGYGFAANACYTLGWIAELWLFGDDPARTESLRPTAFRWGTTFSVLLTLLFGILLLLIWAKGGLS